jgi:four helix bundle protein
MLTYSEWLTTVPETITADPLWKMKAYCLALFLTEIAWHDAAKLASDPRTLSLSDQLFKAVGSIGANIAEGYSRRTGKDRARFYEYALGSARESRHWYYGSRQILFAEVIVHRFKVLAEISRLLLAIIPQERKLNLAEAQVDYETNIPSELGNAPLPT